MRVRCERIYCTVFCTQYCCLMTNEPADIVCFSQQRHAVLSCFNILALVLSSHFLTCDAPLPLSEAAKDVVWLSSVLSILGAYVRVDGS